MTSLDEKFIDFCDLKSSYKIGGVNDIYSEEQTDYFQLNVQTFADEEKTQFVQGKIEQAEIINKEVRNLTLNFDSVYKKGEINVEGEEGAAQPDSKIITNAFPIGKKNFYRPKLENLTKSADIYSDLCQQLFKDVFENKSDELKSIFGSLADYPIIDVDSFGLMPIKDLKELFDEFYLKYEITTSGKSFKKKQFFDQFLNLLGLNKENIKPTIKEINDSILDDIYFTPFNPYIWYNPDIVLTNRNISFDGYGYFDCEDYARPDTLFCFLKFSNDMYTELYRAPNRNQFLIDVKDTILEQYDQFRNGHAVNLHENYNYNRLNQQFSAKKFKDSLDKFFQLNESEKYTIDDRFLRVINANMSIFININGTPDEIELFKKIRYLFHFSNIYTTYSKLLSHFFLNIHKCYEIYFNYIRNFRRKTNKNNSNYEPSELDEIQKRLPNLLRELLKIPESFNSATINLPDVDQPTQRTFYENNIQLFYRGFNNPYNIFITSYRINSDSFKQILQRFFKENKNNDNEENKLIVGGIPFVLKEKPKFNRLIILCYSYFLKYRILSNKNYHELLLNYQTQIEQKVSLEDSKVINSIVDKKIEEIQEALLGINLGEYFERCKKILEISISFVLNLSISTIKNLKIKNKKISQTDMNYKIGELKESIYQYMRELSKKILKLSPKYNIFHEFLLGYLLQYIYVFENYNKSKDERVFEKFEELLSMGNKNRAASIKQYSQNITEILTNDAARKYTRRFFIGRKYEKLGNNAKKEVTKEVNPEIYTSFYWTNYEEKFVSKYGKKLFVIAIEPVVSIVEKIAKVNVWLIDVFATAKSFGKPITRNFIKTVEEVDNNYRVIKERYSNDNNMILLNPFLRTIREFAGWMQKVISRGDKLAKKLHSYELGHLLGKFLGIREKKLNKKTVGASVKDEDYGYTRAEIMRLLINGQLLAYTEDNKDTKIDIGLLMGYDNKQLDSILQEYYKLVVSKGTGKFGTKFKKYRTDMENKTYEDWQLYIIKKGDYESIDKMREWTNNLLNSKPWIFIEDYTTKNRIIPLSNFSKMQAPFERYFIKAQAIHRSPFAKSLPDLLLHIYDMVYQKNFRSGKPNITKKLEKRFFSTETFFDFVLPIDYENRIKGISSNKLLSNKQQNGYLGNNEGDDDNDDAGVQPSRVSMRPGSFSSLGTASRYMGMSSPPSGSSAYPSGFPGRGATRIPVRVAASAYSFSSFRPDNYIRQGLQSLESSLSSSGSQGFGRRSSVEQLRQATANRENLRLLQQQLGELQQVMRNRDEEAKQRQLQMKIDQDALIQQSRLREATLQQQLSSMSQQYQQLESQIASANQTRHQALEQQMRQLTEQMNAQQLRHQQDIQNKTREIEQRYEQEKRILHNQLEEAKNDSIRILQNTIQNLRKEKNAHHQLEIKQLQEQITKLNQDTILEHQALENHFQERLKKVIADINVSSGRGAAVASQFTQRQHVNSSIFGASAAQSAQQSQAFEQRPVSPSAISFRRNKATQQSVPETSFVPIQSTRRNPRNQSSRDKLLAILTNRFRDSLLKSSNNNSVTFTVNNDRYNVDFTSMEITYSDTTKPSHNGFQTVKIEPKGSQNKEVFTASFQNFIIVFDIDTNKIFKNLSLEIGNSIFSMIIELNSNGQHYFWDMNFQQTFTESLSQTQRNFYDLFLNVFSHLQYNEGFGFYTVQRQKLPFYLDIKGGNTDKSDNIIKLVISKNNKIYLINDSGELIEFKPYSNASEERFYFAKVNETNIYLFDFLRNRILKFDGNNLFILSWNNEGKYYDWIDVKSTGIKRDELMNIITKLQSSNTNSGTNQTRKAQIVAEQSNRRQGAGVRVRASFNNIPPITSQKIEQRKSNPNLMDSMFKLLNNAQSSSQNLASGAQQSTAQSNSRVVATSAANGSNRQKQIATTESLGANSGASVNSQNSASSVESSIAQSNSRVVAIPAANGSNRQKQIATTESLRANSGASGNSQNSASSVESSIAPSNSRVVAIPAANRSIIQTRNSTTESLRANSGASGNPQNSASGVRQSGNNNPESVVPQESRGYVEKKKPKKTVKFPNNVGVTAASTANGSKTQTPIAGLRAAPSIKHNISQWPNFNTNSDSSNSVVNQRHGAGVRGSISAQNSIASTWSQNNEEQLQEAERSLKKIEEEFSTKIKQANDNFQKSISLHSGNQNILDGQIKQTNSYKQLIKNQREEKIKKLMEKLSPSVKKKLTREAQNPSQSNSALLRRTGISKEKSAEIHDNGTGQIIAGLFNNNLGNRQSTSTGQRLQTAPASSLNSRKNATEENKLRKSNLGATAEVNQQNSENNSNNQLSGISLRKFPVAPQPHLSEDYVNTESTQFAAASGQQLNANNLGLGAQVIQKKPTVEQSSALTMIKVLNKIRQEKSKNMFLLLPTGQKINVSDDLLNKLAKRYLTKQKNSQMALTRTNNKIFNKLLKTDENGRKFLQFENNGKLLRIDINYTPKLRNNAVEVFNIENNAEAKHRANAELKIKKINPTLPKNTFLERLPPNNREKSKKVNSNDIEIPEEIEEEEEQVETNYYSNNFNSNSEDSPKNSKVQIASTRKKISSQNNSRIGAAAAAAAAPHNVYLDNLSSSSNSEIQLNEGNTYNRPNPVILSKYTSPRTNYRNAAKKGQSVISSAAPSSPSSSSKAVVNPQFQKQGNLKKKAKVFQNFQENQKSMFGIPVIRTQFNTLESNVQLNPNFKEEWTTDKKFRSNAKATHISHSKKSGVQVSNPYQILSNHGVASSSKKNPSSKEIVSKKRAGISKSKAHSRVKDEFNSTNSD